MTNIVKQSLKISVTVTMFFIYALSLANWAMAAEVDTTSVKLKNDQVITDTYVRLHHVFDGVTAQGEHILAPAPAAGETLELGLRDLTRISTAFNLNWTPGDQDPHITLRQDAQVITPVMIKKALEQSVLREKIGSDFSLKLENATQTIAVKGRDDATLLVDDVSYNPITERFSATLSAMRGETRIESVRLQGEAAKITKVPVLSARLRHGDVIETRHISYVDMLNRDVSSNMIINTDELVGMTPRRSLNTDQVILSTDIEAPILVKRNDIISITFKNGPIQLSTKGRAVSQGAKGDVVQIMNNSSKKVIEAIVTGPQQAIVTKG